MRKLFLLFCPVLMLVLSGCASETIAKGLTTKNVSGDGIVTDTHIGLDLDSKIPEIRTFFAGGDFSTSKAGTNAISYREETYSSIWNARCVTKKRFLSITLTDAGDVPAAIRAVAEVFLIASEADKASADATTTAANADTKATTKLLLKTGDQVTGYVVDLEEAKAKNNSNSVVK